MNQLRQSIGNLIGVFRLTAYDLVVLVACGVWMLLLVSTAPESTSIRINVPEVADWVSAGATFAAVLAALKIAGAEAARARELEEARDRKVAERTAKAARVAILKISTQINVLKQAFDAGKIERGIAEMALATLRRHADALDRIEVADLPAAEFAQPLITIDTYARTALSMLEGAMKLSPKKTTIVLLPGSFDFIANGVTQAIDEYRPIFRRLGVRWRLSEPSV